MLACPNSCSQRGQCVEGTCECASGWGGVDCMERVCPRGCGVHGTCGYMHECECDDGWSGEACEDRTCLLGCEREGECVNGTCHCIPGWHGARCHLRDCEPACSSHGRCYKGTCECEHGWGGALCALAVCPNNCTSSAHGSCDSASATCVCNEGFGGDDCSRLLCPNGCSARGLCLDDGSCACLAGHSGLDCSQHACPRDCSSHGVMKRAELERAPALVRPRQYPVAPTLAGIALDAPSHDRSSRLRLCAGVRELPVRLRSRMDRSRLLRARVLAPVRAASRLLCTGHLLLRPRPFRPRVPPAQLHRRLQPAGRV